MDTPHLRDEKSLIAPARNGATLATNRDWVAYYATLARRLKFLYEGLSQGNHTITLMKSMDYGNVKVEAAGSRFSLGA